MRRKEKAMRRAEDMVAVITACRVCHLGMCDDGRPYVVPMHFDFRDGVVWLHSARQGRKMAVLARNPAVCIVFDRFDGLVTHERPCNWGTAYRSVMVFGEAAVVDAPHEKRQALAAIAARYGADPDGVGDREAAATAVIRVTVDDMTGKVSGQPVAPAES